jgi:uncharacterized protein (TIGR02466 family)
MKQIIDCYSIPILKLTLPEDLFKQTLERAEIYIRHNDWFTKEHYGCSINSFYDDGRHCYCEENDKELLEYIDENMSSFVEITNHSLKGTKRIYNSWLNLNMPNTQHPLHQHFNSFVSGVIWLRTPPNSGDFSFQDPIPERRMNHDKYRWAVNEPNHYNSEMYRWKVNAGNMIYYPSWVPHCVYSNETEDDYRLSIAFNMEMGKE